jgi:SEC-C motif
MYCISKLELNRNDPCQCGSGLKYKHCCLKMHQERKRWEGLENNLRESITEYWQEFHENDLYDAINIYGKIIDKNTEVTERRLFFDWFIHDYIIPNKNNNTIIKLFLKEYEKEESKDTIELDTLREWSDSFFRFVEVLEITVGTGYKISDIFTKEEFFLHDVRSSTTVEKYDIIYTRLYRVGGSITRAAGGLVLLPHRYLNNIKKYVISNMRKKHHETDITDSTIFKLNLEKYLKNESLSLIQYLDLLSNQTTDTVTTFQGDIAVLSESDFIITNKRRIISILNSSENFAYVGDYEEGYNDYDDIIRYDWIEKLDVTSSKTNYLIGNNIEKQEEDIDDNELEETRRVQLNTILWLPNSSFASSLSSNKKKKYSRKSNKNEEFVPYRVLGNLSIKGKIMNVSCMSDKLLKKCNDIINNIAGKYLIYLGDKYTELQHDTKENELDVNLKQKSKDNNMISHASEKDLYKHSNENKIPPAITKQIDGFFEKYYENWINMKIPYLDNMTPLEIINTKEGKEKIENLLRDIENEYARSAIGDLPFFPVEKIRKRLGLD